MKAKMCVCNLISVILALLSMYLIFETVFTEEGDLIANLYITVLTIIASIAYHFIGKYA